MIIQCTTDGIRINQFNLLYSLSKYIILLVFPIAQNFKDLSPNLKPRVPFKNREKSLLCMPIIIDTYMD